MAHDWPGRATESVWWDSLNGVGVIGAAEILLHVSRLPDGTPLSDVTIRWDQVDIYPACLTDESLAPQARLFEHRQLPRHFFTVHVLKKTYADADAFHICPCCKYVLPIWEVCEHLDSAKNVSIGQAEQGAQPLPSLP